MIAPIRPRKVHPRPLGRGSKNKASKLTEDVVQEIRMAYRAGRLSVAKIADMVGINHHTAWCAIYGKTWRHVGGAALPVGGGAAAMRKLTPTQVTAARRIYHRGVASIREIKEMLGMNFNAARLMLMGETYQHVPMPDDSFNESLSEHIADGIIRRLHLQHYSRQQRNAIEMAFLAGVQHGLVGGEQRGTQEEVMGAGNGEYKSCRLGVEDLQQLSHAYSEE